MIVTGITYSSAQVAEEVFHRSVDWFYANRRRLERDAGFPRPASPFGHPVWSGADLLAWEARDKSLDGRARRPAAPILELKERALVVARGR